MSGNKKGSNLIHVFENSNFTFRIRIIVSIIVLLASTLLFLYRFFPYADTVKFMGFTNARDFVYFSSIAMTPAVIIVGIFLNAYKIAYIPLLFVYTIDLIWVFNAESVGHYSKINILYALLVTIGFIIVYKALTHVKSFQNQIDQEAQEALDEIQKELDKLTSNKRKK